MEISPHLNGKQMKLTDYLNVSSMFTSITATIKGFITSPAFLLLSSSSIGFIQVFNYRKDLTIDLLLIASSAYLLMTLLGLAKHIKKGEAKAEIFLRKTLEQLIVMVGVILIGYLMSVFIAVVFKIVTDAVPGAQPVPGLALYFIFAGYAIMITYYIIKCCDLIDQIMPKLLPAWFSAPFRKFRETGDYKDLLSFADKVKQNDLPE